MQFVNVGTRVALTLRMRGWTLSKTKWTSAWHTLRDVASETFSKWFEHNVSRLSAALAYYTFFSIAPMLVIIIAIAAMIFGEDALSGRIFEEISGLVGPQAASSIQAMLKSAYRPGSGIVASIVAVIIFFLGSPAMFSPGARRGLWPFAP